MKQTQVITLIALALGMLFGQGIVWLIKAQSDQTRDDCPPIHRERSTGTIRCWSGGAIVYDNYIYHNGSLLCSTEGKEIKITGGKSLCVIESDQANDWTLPALDKLTIAGV